MAETRPGNYRYPLCVLPGGRNKLQPGGYDERKGIIFGKISAKSFRISWALDLNSLHCRENQQRRSSPITVCMHLNPNTRARAYQSEPRQWLRQSPDMTSFASRFSAGCFSPLAVFFLTTFSRVGFSPPPHPHVLFVLVAPPPAVVVEPGTVCSNDLPGVEAKGVCCKAGCGECGGPNCGQVPGLTGDDCCTSTIQNSNVTCSQAGAAPCILDPEGELHQSFALFRYSSAAAKYKAMSRFSPFVSFSKLLLVVDSPISSPVQKHPWGPHGTKIECTTSFTPHLKARE